jgi:hypothetical protein
MDATVAVIPILRPTADQTGLLPEGAREPGQGVMVDRPAYAALRLADFFDELRFDDRFRRRPRCRVEVSKGLCVDAGLSCRAHQSVLLYRDNRTSHCGSMQIRSVP